MARVGVPREIAPDETRVALTPETVGKLTKAGFEIVVEAGAGTSSGYEPQAPATGSPTNDGARSGRDALLPGSATCRTMATFPGLRSDGAHPSGRG